MLIRLVPVTHTKNLRMRYKLARTILAGILLLLPLLLSAQLHTITGRVNDSATLEPLAFVNIVINDGRQGGMTDIDGRFTLESREPIRFLRFSYVGYRPEIVYVTGSNLQLRMVSLGVELTEVLIEAGENPAHRIISNAIANRKRNDPKNIPAYSFTSYDKMLFTVNKDSLQKQADAETDSSGIRLMKFLEDQHLFLMESVAEHRYERPGKSTDKVIATRVSGLRDPLFIFLISTMQSASFYEETIHIAGSGYINPVSPNAVFRYFFGLQDTLFGETSGDTTFVISFRPRPNRNFDGLKGLLYISNNGWAIRNVIAEPARPDESMSIRIRQMYEFLENRYWFPVQLETEITLNTVMVNRARPVGLGKSYRRDIAFDSIPRRTVPVNIAVELAPGAGHRDEMFWNRYRADSLTRLEVNTYRVIDSLSKEGKLEQRLKGLTSLASGRIPLGYVDLDLNRLIRYNRHEGLYAGLGITTSKRLSRVVEAGGYWGYGFRDNIPKYGASLGLRLQRQGNARLSVSYSNDLAESGGTRFFDDAVKPFDPMNFRSFYIDRLDLTESAGALFSFRMFRYVWAGAGIRREDRKPVYEYAFAPDAAESAGHEGSFVTGAFIAGIRFAYGEKFVRSAGNQLSLGTRFPVLWLQYTGGRDNFLDGTFRFDRLDMRLKWSFKIRMLGTTTVWVTGSMVDGRVPVSDLIAGRGSAGGGFSLWSPVSFSTMKPSEFVSDREGSVFFTHSFGKLLFRSGKFEPEPALLFNAGFGSLKHPGDHRNIRLSTMEKGYYETGIAINNIITTPFSGMGVAVLQRLGPYSHPEARKNTVARLTFSFAF